MTAARQSRRVVERRSTLMDLVERKQLVGRAARGAMHIAADFSRVQSSPPGFARRMAVGGDRPIRTASPGTSAHDRIERMREWLPPSLREILSAVWSAEIGGKPIMGIAIQTGYADGAQHRAAIVGNIQAMCCAAADWYEAQR